MKYSAKFKLQVVKFAQESNNCAAGREFCVNEKFVRDWRKLVEKICFIRRIRIAGIKNITLTCRDCNTDRKWQSLDTSRCGIVALVYLNLGHKGDKYTVESYFVRSQKLTAGRLQEGSTDYQGSKLTTSWSHMRLDFWLCA